MPQRLRLVGSKRESTNVRAAKRQCAQEARLAVEYDNTVAALAFVTPRVYDLFTTTGAGAGWLILVHISKRFEDELYAYVTGDTVPR